MGVDARSLLVSSTSFERCFLLTTFSKSMSCGEKYNEADRCVCIDKMDFRKPICPMPICQLHFRRKSLFYVWLLICKNSNKRYAKLVAVISDVQGKKDFCQWTSKPL
jgi:hypothetical protein